MDQAIGILLKDAASSSNLEQTSEPESLHKWQSIGPTQAFDVTSSMSVSDTVRIPFDNVALDPSKLIGKWIHPVKPAGEHRIRIKLAGLDGTREGPGPTVSRYSWYSWGGEPERILMRISHDRQLDGYKREDDFSVRFMLLDQHDLPGKKKRGSYLFGTWDWSSMEVDAILRDCLDKAYEKGSSSQHEGLYISDATIGMKMSSGSWEKPPHEVHRVVGLKFGDMETLGWVQAGRVRTANRRNGSRGEGEEITNCPMFDVILQEGSGETEGKQKGTTGDKFDDATEASDAEFEEFETL